jgi:hypothetical protein
VKPGRPDLYAYVGNDPFNRIDPSGRDWSSIGAGFSLNASQYGLSTAATFASGQISLSACQVADIASDIEDFGGAYPSPPLHPKVGSSLFGVGSNDFMLAA